MPFELEMVLRLLLAAVLSGVIGYQRERIGKPAGLRTNMLIGVGATLFTIVSIYGFPNSSADTSRVAAAVVIGVGFIGGGVILHRNEREVEGLTTAATIWTVAGVGLAAGSGMYLLAIAAAAIILVTLLLPHKVG